MKGGTEQVKGENKGHCQIVFLMNFKKTCSFKHSVGSVKLQKQMRQVDIIANVKIWYVACFLGNMQNPQTTKNAAGATLLFLLRVSSIINLKNSNILSLSLV